jgi:hypothetical protein
MSNIFTSEKINALSTEIDRQLRQLRAKSDLGEIKGEAGEPKLLPEKQSQAIAEITKAEPKSFLKKFRLAAKSDLCEEGGLLNNQWKKWTDLNNKDVVDKFGIVLAALGFSGAALEMLVVALAVIVIHIGVKAFCEEYFE